MTTTENRATLKVQELHEAAGLVLKLAAERPDISVRAVHMSDDHLSFFCDDAGSREHLANTVGLHPTVRTNFTGQPYRVGLFAGVQIRIYGRDW